jgi:hypothetical protein
MHYTKELPTRFGLGCGVQRHFPQYFNYIWAVSFVSGGNHRTGENHRLFVSYWQTMYSIHRYWYPQEKKLPERSDDTTLLKSLTLYFNIEKTVTLLKRRNTNTILSVTYHLWHIHSIQVILYNNNNNILYLKRVCSIRFHYSNLRTS